MLPLMQPEEPIASGGGGPLVQIVRRGSGYAARGAGFYLWDEDAAELLRSAAELATAAGRARPRRATPEPRNRRRPPRLA